MEIIEFKRAPEQLASAAEFLRNYGSRVTTKSNQLVVDGAKHRDIKLLLHKFLRHQGLAGYRILSGPGIIEIFPPHLGKAPIQQKGNPPSAAATMPYFFPGSPPVHVERRVRKKRET